MTPGLVALETSSATLGVVMTLSRENLGEVDWVLETAERTGSKAVFQLLQSGTCNAPRSAAGHLPTPDETRRTLRMLLEYRLAGRPVGPGGRQGPVPW